MPVDDHLLDVRRARAARIAAAVAVPAAITSVVAAGANPTKAEYDALRTDLINTRTQLAALVTSLNGAGVIS
jgi:hypothetical protein